MPPSKEAIVKQIEHDRDFALVCLKRKLTDAQTIRRLVGQMKAEGFKNPLADLMVRQGILTDTLVAELESELALKEPQPSGSERPSGQTDKPDLPGYSFKEVLSERAGTIYRVRADGDSDDQCLHILPNAFTNNTELKKHFRELFERVKSLQHPMLCQLGNFIETKKFAYYTTEFIPGPTLDDVMRQNDPFSGRIAMGFIKVLSGVLAHAHQKGVIHHDLHPKSLVFLPNRQMRFRDYGLERFINDSLKVKDSDTIRCFRSPEDLKGSHPHEADDLFGLGALLYFVVTGTRPPRATASGNVALPNLQKAAPHHPPDVVSIITRLLLPRLARIASISELTQALAKPITNSYSKERADPFLKSEKNSGFDMAMPRSANKPDDVGTLMLFGTSPAPAIPPSPRKSGSFESTGQLSDAAPAKIRENFPGEFGGVPILPGQVPSMPMLPGNVVQTAGPTDNSDLNATTVRELDVKQIMKEPIPTSAPSLPAGHQQFDFSTPMPSSHHFGKAPGADGSTLLNGTAEQQDAVETALPSSMPTLKAMQQQAKERFPDATDPNSETFAHGVSSPMSRAPADYVDYQRVESTSVQSYNDQPLPYQDNDFNPNAQALVDPATPEKEPIDRFAQTLLDYDPHAPTRVHEDGSDEDVEAVDQAAQTMLDYSATPEGSAALAANGQLPDVVDPCPQTAIDADPVAPVLNAGDLDNGKETHVLDNPMSAIGLLGLPEASIPVAPPATALPKNTLAIPHSPKGPPRPKTDTEIDDRSDEDMEKSSSSEEFDPAAQTLILDQAPTQSATAKKDGEPPLAPNAPGPAKEAPESLSQQDIEGFRLGEVKQRQGPWEFYPAKRIRDSREVIFKVLRSELDDDLKIRLQQEIEALVGFKNGPRVETLKAGLTPGGEIYCASEAPKAESVGSLMAWGPMTFDRAADLLAHFIHGFSKMQGLNFVHGALSELSVGLMRNGASEFFVMTDLGYYHLLRDVLCASPFVPPEFEAYLSPEFRERREVDARSDIYSLGILAYRIFTGHFPYLEGETFGQIRSFKDIDPGLSSPAGLDVFCAKAISAKPDERFQNHEEMLAALRKVRQDYQALSQSPKHQKAGKRKGLILGLVLVFLMVLTAILLFVFKAI
jgi:serine/threonine protein kinase